MRNFARINNYYNRIEARKDWDRLAKYAHELGLSDVVQRLQPKDKDGWRTIDKQIAELRSYIRAEENA